MTGERPLQGRVAVVAGATRGAGRGIARALGAAGATVWCTGRSVRGGLASGADRPETIEETAELVTASGGEGRSARVDHTVEDDVRALFERVDAESGRLDVLVLDVWGGDALTEWGRPFWELEFSKARLMLERAVLAHILTARHGVPLMVRGASGLVVEITDGDEETNARYRGNLSYDLAKVAPMRLARGMAEELRDTGVTALCVTPGFLRSEAMLDRLGVTEETWRDAIEEDPAFASSESPLFVGRAVAALAADPHVSDKAGRSLASWTLAREYGFSDADGRRPDMGAYFDEQQPERWSAIVTLVQEGLVARGLDPEADLELDPRRFRLIARVDDGFGGVRSLAWPVSVVELWFVPAARVADGFLARFDRERGAG